MKENNEIFQQINDFAVKRWTCRLQQKLRNVLNSVDDIRDVCPPMVVNKDVLFALEPKDNIMLFDDSDNKACDWIIEDYQDEFEDKREARDKRLTEMHLFSAACVGYGECKIDEVPSIPCFSGDKDYDYCNRLLENAERSRKYMYVLYFVFCVLLICWLFVLVLLFCV